jgi:gliding motility-associated-like protein
MMKISSTGVVQESTYFGSPAYDQLYFIDTDEQGNPYVYGQSLAGGNYWIQNVSWSQANSGMVVAKMTNNLSSLQWATTFGSGGGLPNLSPAAFLVDVCNQIYLSGWGGAVNQMSNTQVGTTQNLWVSSNAFQNSTTGSDFYLLVIDANASSPVYGSYFGGAVSAEHVDGGTSRFDRKGIIYQSVCAGCGNHDDFPIYPSNAVSSINASNNCNNGVFKYDFELSLTYALAIFEDEICAGDSIYVQGQFQNAQSLIWELDGAPIATDLPSFWLAFADTGNFYLNLIAIDSATCNVIDQSGHFVHVVGPQIVNEGMTHLCLGDSVLLGIDNPVVGASYQWFPANYLSSDTLSNVVFYGNQSQQYALAIQHGLCTDTSYFSVVVDDVEVLLPGDSVVCNASNLLVDAAISPTTANLIWSDQMDFTNPLGQQSSYNWSLGNFEVLYVQAEFNGCIDVDSMHVSVLTLDAVVEGDQTVCKGDTLWLNVVNPISGVNYSWLENPNIISALDSSAVWVVANTNGEYYLSTSIPGCSRIDSISLSVSPLAQEGIAITAEPTVVFSGEEVNLSVDPIHYEYQWQGEVISGVSNGVNVQLIPSQSQWVYCYASDGECSSLDSIWIRVEEWTCGDKSIFIPTAFSPNENGSNDLLYVYGVEGLEFSLSIFDRWGNEVFTAQEAGKGWDGTYHGALLQSAVFHFILKVDCDGVRSFQKEGNITLMR